MSLTKKELKSIIKEYRKSVKDDGNYEFDKDDLLEVFNNLDYLYSNTKRVTVREARESLNLCLLGSGATNCECEPQL